MLMADTMAVFFVILGVMLALPGLWLLCLGLWPRAVAETAERSRKGLVWSFLIGFPVSVVVFILTLKLLNILGGPGKAMILGLFSIFFFYSQVGVSGLATSIGRRLVSSTDLNREWRATMRGGVVLELTFLLPVLGWFIILPASIAIGVGATLRFHLRSIRNSLTLVRVKPALSQGNSDEIPIGGGIERQAGAM